MLNVTRRLSPIVAPLALVAVAASSPVRAAARLAQQSPALPSGVARVTSVEGISEYRLDNGLRVLLFPDVSKPTITVNMTYLVGSRHESYGETGMAHLLEHLLFKGTPSHPNIPQELTEHGAESNGTTWYDRTNYFETVAASDENLVIERLARECFGSWRSPRGWERLREIYKPVPGVSKVIEVSDRPNAAYVAGLPLDIRDDDPDYPALLLANFILGGGFLNSRLGTRIRQKEGISYGVWSGLSVSALDRRGWFLIGAIYAPENRARLEAAMSEELARALRDGFSTEEVVGAKQGFLQSRRLDRADDGSLAGLHNWYALIDRTFAWDAELERKVAALTAGEVTAALRKHLDPAKLVVVKAGSFAPRK